MTIHDLLKYTFQVGASDLHIVAGSPPSVRIDGKLLAVPQAPVLTPQMAEEFVKGVLTPEQIAFIEKNREQDFSLALPDVGRFRANAYFQKRYWSISLRTIQERIPSIEELRLPRICHTFAALKQGFILVAGPTGHGKSTTLAAIIEEINVNRSVHIVTIEDPIEFVYQNKKSIVSQRELGFDTLSWSKALRSTLREDPDVVLVGEMRDPETTAAAITIAETGHLVFATLHTNSAAQTIDRIIDSFQESQQNQIRMQLASSLEAVFSQRLVPAKSGGRVPACEVMVSTPAVRNVIREAKTHQIDSMIQTSSDMGMMTLETSLAGWVNQGVVDFDTAREYSLRPQELTRLVSKG